MCFRVHTTLERFSLSLSVSEAMEVCTSNTPSPQAQTMEVCVHAPARSLLVHVLTLIVCWIYPLSKESSLCVCVCVCLRLSLSLSLSLVFSLNGGVCVPPHPRSPPPFPSPLPLYPSLSLSLYLVLPHVSYPTCTCFSHPIPICGHRTVKAPYPVRSAKLSTVSTS